MSADTTAAKLKSYLQTLSPRALALIIRGLENGSNSSSDEMILRIAREVAGRSAGPSIEDATDMAAPQPAGEQKPSPEEIEAALKSSFFNKYKDFLAERACPYKIRGLIGPDSIDAIWAWMCRDVAPDRLERLKADALKRSVVPSTATDDGLANAIDEIFGEMAEFTENAERAPVGRQRLAGQLGDEQILEDLEDCLAIRHAWPDLAPILDRLPDELTLEDIAPDQTVRKDLLSYVDRRSDHAAWIAAAVFTRSATPRTLSDLAVAFAGSDQSKDIAASIYAPFVEIILFDLETQVEVMARSIDNPASDGDTVAEMRRFHEEMRGLQVAIDFDSATSWRSKLSDLRKRMSEILGRQIEPVAGAIQRGLRLARQKNDSGLYVDEHAIEDAEHGLRLLMAAKAASESVALNELLAKSVKSVEQALEILASNAFEKARTDDAGLRPSWEKIAEHSVSLSAIYFGEEYAGLLRRSLSNLADPPAANAG